MHGYGVRYSDSERRRRLVDDNCYDCVVPGGLEEVRLQQCRVFENDIDGHNQGNSDKDDHTRPTVFMSDWSKFRKDTTFCKEQTRRDTLNTAFRNPSKWERGWFLLSVHWWTQGYRIVTNKTPGTTHVFLGKRGSNIEATTFMRLQNETASIIAMCWLLVWLIYKDSCHSPCENGITIRIFIWFFPCIGCNVQDGK